MRIHQIDRTWALHTEDQEMTSRLSQAFMLIASYTGAQTLLGESKDWLAQCQDNVTEWYTRSWCW